MIKISLSVYICKHSFGSNYTILTFGKTDLWEDYSDAQPRIKIFVAPGLQVLWGHQLYFQKGKKVKYLFLQGKP